MPDNPRSAETIRQLVADMKAVCDFDRAASSGMLPRLSKLMQTDPELRRIAKMWSEARQ
jgi:hypothetical protein